MANMLSRHKKPAQPKKTRQDHAEDALYREVWEDVNNEKTQEFLKKYSKIIISIVIGIMILVVGAQIVSRQMTSNRIAMAENYEMAVNNMDATALLNLAKNHSNSTSDLAMFQSWMLDKNNDTLKILSENADTKDFRDLATLHLAMINGDDMTADEMIKFLKPLNTLKSPFYYNAALIIAQKYIADGDKKSADIWLDKIISDKYAPSIVSANASALK